MCEEVERLALGIRKLVLELSHLAVQEPAAMRREARLALQSATLRLLSLAATAASEVERLEERLLQNGLLVRQDEGTALTLDSLQLELSELSSEFQRIRVMRPRTVGRSSMH